jgi:O-antigen ligase
MALGATAASLAPRNPGAPWMRAQLARLLDWSVALWIFMGGFVINEPSPYELSFLLVLAIALFAGFGLHRATAGLLVIFALFIPFALIAAFQTRIYGPTDALIFQAVTIFLLFTGYFVANYVADAPQKRMRLIMGAYIATALVGALAGTLGYLSGSELLTRFGRAKAFFNDPNVYGPFLILPAMYLLQRVLLGTKWRALWAGVLFMVIAIGVFASFSRAAWGHLAASAGLVLLLVFFLETQAREKVRIMLIAMAGALVMLVAIAGMLSIPQVSRLFEVRASAQNYDEGETGRFGRQGYAWDMALQNPLGIGPNEFSTRRITELPHNAYVNVLLVYGWGGGLLFYVLVGTTIWRGLSHLARPSPNRLLLIPLVATFIPLAIEAAIIDLDHWRHFFLVAGLIWGVTAAYDRIGPGENKRHAALI